MACVMGGNNEHCNSVTIIHLVMGNMKIRSDESISLEDTYFNYSHGLTYLHDLHNPRNNNLGKNDDGMEHDRNTSTPDSDREV